MEISIRLLGITLAVGAAWLLYQAGIHNSNQFWGQDNAAWWQAVFSVVAIAVGLGVALGQAATAKRETKRNTTEAATAAYALAVRTLEQVADRLFVAVRPFSKTSAGLALRELRTTEMVETLRELDVRRLPPEMVVPISTVRSDLYAVNARITQLYRSEEDSGRDERDRPKRIRSCLVIYSQARATLLEIPKKNWHHGVIVPPRFDEPDGLDALISGALKDRRADSSGEVSVVFPDFSET